MVKKIIISGDIHGNWKHLNQLIKNESPDIILQCGDFGFWPHFHNSKKFIKGQKFDQYNIKSKNTEIYFCDGNHENHEILQKLVSKIGRIPIKLKKFQNVFYMPRCSVLKIENKNILFMGGASSVDKDIRLPYMTWWPEEELSQNDFNCLPEINIDIVISHTVPEKCLHFIDKYFKFGHKKDFSRNVLDHVLEKYKPTQWFLAHWHIYKKWNYNDCAFTCLNMSPYSKWFEYL